MIVIIQDKSYLEKSFAIVDGDEYRETMMNIKFNCQSSPFLFIQARRACISLPPHAIIKENGMEGKMQ